MNTKFGTQAMSNWWINSYKEENCDHSNYLLDKELLILIFNQLSYPEQSNCRLVCRRWLCLMPVTSFFSGNPPAQLTFISAFFSNRIGLNIADMRMEIDMTLERANLNLDNPSTCCTSLANFFSQIVRKSEILESLMDGVKFHQPPPENRAVGIYDSLHKAYEIVTFANFFLYSAAQALFLKAILEIYRMHLKDDSKFNGTQVDYLNSLLIKSFQIVVALIGFNFDYSRFHLDFVFQASSAIFQKSEILLSSICSELIEHKETLLEVNLCPYDKMEWSEDEVERLLIVLREVKSLEILNLEGCIITLKHIDLLDQLLSENLDVKELHLTQSKLIDVAPDDLLRLTDRSMKFFLHTSDPIIPYNVKFIE